MLLWWRAHSAPAPSAGTLGWIFLATALIVTVTNKTLSPQYLLWLGGPAAALAVRAPADPAVRTFARVLLVTAVATQLVFPIGYNALLKTHSNMAAGHPGPGGAQPAAAVADLVRGAPGLDPDQAARVTALAPVADGPPGRCGPGSARTGR